MIALKMARCGSWVEKTGIALHNDLCPICAWLQNPFPTEGHLYERYFYLNRTVGKQ